ncbi:5499_t:CDS:2 [Funneliformis geosporum]|nr:5499_t:CDS:2 [Funneliformis geosporum]
MDIYYKCINKKFRLEVGLPKEEKISENGFYEVCERSAASTFERK